MFSCIQSLFVMQSYILVCLRKLFQEFFFFLAHGDKIWPISDKCLFGVCNDFEAYFDELMIRKVLF